MIILVNWVTNFRPPKFKKSSILTPCFQILGNTLARSLIVQVASCSGTTGNTFIFTFLSLATVESHLHHVHYLTMDPHTYQLYHFSFTGTSGLHNIFLFIFRCSGRSQFVSDPVRYSSCSCHRPCPHGVLCAT